MESFALDETSANGYDNKEIALNCGNMPRECIKFPFLAKYIYWSLQVLRCFSNLWSCLILMLLQSQMHFLHLRISSLNIHWQFLNSQKLTTMRNFPQFQWHKARTIVEKHH